MFRPHYVIASMSLLFVPILDATIKGTVVLLLAGLVCLILRRDSAATRHLVWATAVMLLLAMPLLSLWLPQWRVLPNWPQVKTDAVSSSLTETRFLDDIPYTTESPPPQEFPGSVAGDSDPIVLPPDLKPTWVEPAQTVPAESAAPHEPGIFTEILARGAAERTAPGVPVRAASEREPFEHAVERPHSHSQRRQECCRFSYEKLASRSSHRHGERQSGT